MTWFYFQQIIPLASLSVSLVLNNCCWIMFVKGIKLAFPSIDHSFTFPPGISFQLGT